MPTCRRSIRRTPRSPRPASRSTPASPRCTFTPWKAVTVTGRPIRELIGYFDDVLAVIDHPVVIAVNPTMGYIPKPPVIAQIIRRHQQIVGARLSGQPQIYLIDLQDMVDRTIEYHWQLGSGALDPLALGATLFAAEANIIPETFRSFIDHARAGRFADAGKVLADIRRFNRLIMQWGPCARWIKVCMQILRLPGWEGGLRKPYLMPPDDEMRRLRRRAVAPARAGNRRDGARRRPRASRRDEPVMPKRSFIALFLFTLTAINYIDRLALSMAAKPVAAGVPFVAGAAWLFVLVVSLGLRAGQHPDGHAGRSFRRRTHRRGGHRGLVGRHRLHRAGISYLMLMASRFVMGGGEAVTNPCGARIVREWFPAAERGTVNAVFNAGAFAGPALSALVVGYLIQVAGWRIAFVAAGAIGFVWLAAWWRWFDAPERVPGCRTRNANQHRRTTWHDSAMANAIRPARAGLAALLRTRTMWGLALIGGADAYCSYLFLSWLPSYLQTARHFSLGTTSVYTAVPYATAFVISISVAQISDRF